MATLEIRRQLEALMGKEAMGGREDTRNWDDPQVCKMFLKRCCLHDLFTNTKKDMGPCPNLHLEKHRMQYEQALADRGTPFPSVESEYEDMVTQFVTDCDAKIKVYRRRLEQTQGKTPDDPATVEKMKQINDYENDITALTAEVERLGEAGQIDESMATLEKIEEIKSKKEEAQKALAEAGGDNNEQNQRKLRVCDICSAYLSAFESDRRLADHFAGKMHLGYQEMRNRAEEVQKKRAERLASLPTYDDRNEKRFDRPPRDEPPPSRHDDRRPPYGRDRDDGRGGPPRGYDQRSQRPSYDDDRRRYRDDYRGGGRGGPRRDRSRSPRR